MKVKFQYFTFIVSILVECLIAFQSDSPLVLRYMKETIQEHYLLYINEVLC